MDRAKQSSGCWFQQHDRGARLWQRSYWDRILRDEDDLWPAIRYLLANPVRARLAVHPLAYPFSGSAVYDRQVLVQAFDYQGDPRG
jgi:hypothetical protein